jgi:hypothetical protein
MPNLAGVIDLSSLSADDQAAVDVMAEGVEPESESETAGLDARQPVDTLFVVFRALDGQVIGTADPDILNVIRPLRQATADDLYGMSAVVQKDITAAESGQAAGQAVQAALMQQMQQVKAAQEEAQIRSRLKI